MTPPEQIAQLRITALRKIERKTIFEWNGDKILFDGWSDYGNGNIYVTVYRGTENVIMRMVNGLAKPEYMDAAIFLRNYHKVELVINRPSK